MARFGDFDQYLDNAGDPLVSGKIYFYESGTTTFKNTYSDINNSIPNTNPVILTAAGRQPNIFFDGVAKAILATSADVQIAVRDPVGQTESAFGDQWVATKIYSATDVVLGSDGVFYRSLANGNQNNNPVSTSGFWTLLYSVEWNAGITYASGAMVTYGDVQYQSLQGTNLNQNPATQTAYWVPLNFAWLSTSTYALDQNVVGTDGILYTSIQAANTGNEPSVSALWWVGTSAAAAASAIAAAASAAAAAADAVQTGLDAAATAADAIATAADAVQTGLDAAATAADVILTNADAVATAADRVQTGLDAAATAADVIATAADAVQTGLDVIATNADVVLTNADVVSTNADVVLTNADVVLTAADAAATALDKIATNADVVLTGLDVVSTNADVVLTAADVVSSSGSASAAAGSAAAAATTYDNFDDRYLGDKASDPTLDNDGNPLLTGALYFNTVSNAMKVYTGSAWSAVAPVATSVTLSQVTDFPSQSGETGKYLTTNGTVPSWATLVTDPTLGTLTQTFTNGQETTISLTSTVLAPVVTVTKEVPQSGVTNNNWDVNSTAENYTRLDSATATTLTPSATGDGTFTLGAGSFTSADIGKTITGNGGVAVLTTTGGAYVTSTAFTDTSEIASGSWEMYGVVYNTVDGDLELSGVIDPATGFDVSTAVYSQFFSVAGQTGLPTDLAFSANGTKMFVIGLSEQAVYEYSLSTGFDVFTASFVDSFSVSAQETSPRGLVFNTDGTKMFIVGTAGQDINEYTLSTAFSVSTSSFVDSFSVSAQDTVPVGLAFNADGTKMFVVGGIGQDINEYTLSTGFDVSTASFVDSFSVSAQDTSPQGLAFNTAGTKMFVLGATGADVNEYTLSVGFDVSTASFVDSFSVSAQESSPYGLAFNTAGTKMFVVGSSGDNVNEYSVGTTLTPTGYQPVHTTQST
jgi:hypothetical protein